VTYGPIIAALLAAAAVVILFLGAWRSANRPDPVAARLDQYGATASDSDAPPPRRGRFRLSFGPSLAAGGKAGTSLARKLSEADMPLTAPEWSLLHMGVIALGAGFGWWRGGLLFALVVGGIAAIVPVIYLNMRASRRRDAFTNQIPDVLTLFVGALRAGYGISQSMDLLVERLPQPSATEYARTMRAVGLGLPVTRALNDMAGRVDSDDMDLVVTAMTVQQELGGNLAQILDTIAETIRERIRIKREIRVMTSQQRMTGIILALLPVAAVLIIGTLNREYMSNLFTTTIGRIMVAVAILLEIVGWLIIRKIVDIEV
jgi:tight adherence protein B